MGDVHCNYDRHGVTPLSLIIHNRSQEREIRGCYPCLYIYYRLYSVFHWALPTKALRGCDVLRHLLPDISDSRILYWVIRHYGNPSGVRTIREVSGLLPYHVLVYEEAVETTRYSCRILNRKSRRGVP